MIHALPAPDDSRRVRLDGWRLPRAEVEAFATAHQLLAFARERMARLEATCQARLEAADRRGYAEGLARGHADAAQATAAALTGLARAAAARDAELRAGVAALALAVVRRIAGELGPETMMAHLVEQALAETIDDGPYAVRVAPSATEAVAARIGAQQGLRVIADPALPADACVFETRQGLIDASLEVQLAALAAALGADRVADAAS